VRGGGGNGWAATGDLGAAWGGTSWAVGGKIELGRGWAACENGPRGAGVGRARLGQRGKRERGFFFSFPI
jgi:hypothetical protein